MPIAHGHFSKLLQDSLAEQFEYYKRAKPQKRGLMDKVREWLCARLCK